MEGAQRLPARTKAGFGAAEAGMAGVEAMLQLYLLPFYTGVVGLEPRYAGLALALAVLWDAVTDPVMGAVSDRTRSRWGRRRPYMAAGALGLLLAFEALFHPPALDGQAAKFAYLLGCYMLVNTAMTLYAVPYAALSGEMCFDRDERTEIFGWRFFFRNAGFFVGAVLPGFIAYAVANGSQEAGLLRASRAYAGDAIGAAIAVSAAVMLWSVRRLDRPTNAAPAPARGLRGTLVQFVQGLAAVLRSPVFFPLLLAFIIAQIGRTLNASFGLYFYTERLRLPEAAFSSVLGVFMIFMVSGILPWVWLSRRYGKKGPAFAGVVALGALTCVSYPLMPPGLLWPPMVFAAGIGGLLIGAVILFESLVADIVDYDELRSGQHREGLYFGCWTMATKVCRAVGLAGTGLMLEVIGFEPGAAQQPAEVAARIAWIFGPGVGVCFIGAGIAFLWMPLDRATHARVQRLLTQRWARRESRAR